jgi:hypothetical protein
VSVASELGGHVHKTKTRSTNIKWAQNVGEEASKLYYFQLTTKVNGLYIMLLSFTPATRSIVAR